MGRSAKSPVDKGSLPQGQAAAIRRLAALREAFGAEAADERLALLKRFGRRRCARRADVTSLHESLCFSRAYPDNRDVLDVVERLLSSWERRADVKQHGDALLGLGMAGVENRYGFYWPTARWLAERWPQSLHVDWRDAQAEERVGALLKLLMPRAESPGLEELSLTAQEWVAHLRRDTESDGTFLVRRFAEAEMDERWREHTFDSLDLPFVLAPGEGSPSRTRAFIPRMPRAWQTAPRSAARPDLRVALGRGPRRIQHASPRRGRELIDVAREAMLTRARDLEQIAYADPRDAWVIDDGDGLGFVALGMVPERRFLLEATYVYLVVKNGVPVGYLQGSGLGGWAEINFNVFEPWRGRDAAALYARSVAVIHAFQHVRTFIVDPYQLGDGNAEALESGAWWFYYKLGFRPRDRATRALVRHEVARLARRKGARSSLRTLAQLAQAPLFFSVGAPVTFPYGGVGPVGLHASAHLSRHGGGHRRDALEQASDEAAAHLRVERRELKGPEREAFREWSAIVVSLPGIDKAPRALRRSLLDVVRARGGRTERAYIEALEGAPEVLEVLARLARRPVRGRRRGS